MAENASPQRSIQTDMTSDTRTDPKNAASARGPANVDTAPKARQRGESSDDIEEMWDNVPI